jgi:mannose-6-phosphate isomerase-like protein (cupin superfamily)
MFIAWKSGPEDRKRGNRSVAKISETPSGESRRFDLHELARQLPEAAESMLIDIRLTDEAAASSRIFRIYKPVPAHFHRTCDEYLIVLSGRARFQVGAEAPVELTPGQMQFFRRNIVHGFPEILEEPLVILSVDTPRRDPSDVIFVDASSGNAHIFLQSIPGY